MQVDRVRDDENAGGGEFGGVNDGGNGEFGGSDDGGDGNDFEGDGGNLVVDDSQ